MFILFFKEKARDQCPDVITACVDSQKYGFACKMKVDALEMTFSGIKNTTKSNLFFL